MPPACQTLTWSLTAQPWLSRHAADVSFSAIIEPNTALAEQRLKENQEGPHGQKWANCQLFKSHRDMLKAQAWSHACQRRKLDQFPRDSFSPCVPGVCAWLAALAESWTWCDTLSQHSASLDPAWKSPSSPANLFVVVCHY